MDFSKWIFLDRVSGDRYTCVYSMQKGAPPSFGIVSFLIPSPEGFAVFVPPRHPTPPPASPPTHQHNKGRAEEREKTAPPRPAPPLFPPPPPPHWEFPRTVV